MDVSEPRDLLIDLGRREGREGGVNHLKASLVELQFITHLRDGGLVRRLSGSSRVEVVELQPIRDQAATRGK